MLLSLIAESVSRSKTSTQVRKSLSFPTTPPKVVSAADDARSPELQLLSNSILEQPSPACFSRKRSRTEDEKHLDKENISVSGNLLTTYVLLFAYNKQEINANGYVQTVK